MCMKYTNGVGKSRARQCECRSARKHRGWWLVWSRGVAQQFVCSLRARCPAPATAPDAAGSCCRCTSHIMRHLQTAQAQRNIAAWRSAYSALYARTLCVAQQSIVVVAVRFRCRLLCCCCYCRNGLRDKCVGSRSSTHTLVVLRLTYDPAALLLLPGAVLLCCVKIYFIANRQRGFRSH